MFCPNCKCEYIRGVTQCADCDVALVDALDPLSPGLDDGVRIVPVWRGRDPGEFDAAKQALHDAGILFTVPDSKGSFSFIASEQNLEVWVAEPDQEKARKIFSDLEGQVDPSELTPEELESLALSESDQEDIEETTNQPLNLPEHWYEDQPVVEVWSGGDQKLADNLISCLREVGIAWHEFSEESHLRLVVLPEQEARAKEIVREVVEASPPE